MAGLRPVVEIMYVDFFTVCADQIINQAAKLRYMSGGKVSIPMVIRTQQGGGTCEAAQHSQNLEALFAHVPGLKVVMARSSVRAAGRQARGRHRALLWPRGGVRGPPGCRAAC